jgi:UDP-N-acetylmuramate dehydrogenase
MTIGGAEVSDKHANFIIAHPGCRADDVLKLINVIKERVLERNQILLESEVRIWS